MRRRSVYPTMTDVITHRWNALPSDRRLLVAIIASVAYLLPLGVLQIQGAGPRIVHEARGFNDNGPLAYAVLLGGLALLLAAWSRPFVSLVTIGILFTGQTFLHLYDPSAEQVLLDIAAFLVVVRGKRREIAVALVICAVVDVTHSTPWRVPFAVSVYNVAFFVSAFAAGVASYRSREAVEAAVEARQALAELQQREQVQAAVRERAAIAADLQPFVVAGVAGMCQRARLLKRAVMAGRSVDATEVQHLEKAGRSCLADLRSVLAVLTAAVDQAPNAPADDALGHLGSERAAQTTPGRRWVVDVLLMVTMAGLALQEEFTLNSDDGGRLGISERVLLALLPVLPLVLRRRLPLVAPLLTVAGAVTVDALAPDNENVFTFLTVFALAYSAAAYAGRRGAVLALTAAAGQLVSADIGPPEFSQTFAVGVIAPLLAESIFAVVAGLLVRQRRALAEEVHLANVRLVEGRERAIADAVLLERLQVARDMHDVVGHGITVMVVQSGAARALLGRDRERAVTALREVERGGKVALAELQTLAGGHSVGDLTIHDLTRAGLAELVSRTAGGSVTVDLTFAGRSRPITGASAVALKHVVVESLTNVIKYGQGSVDVGITYRSSGVEIVVTNPVSTSAAGSEAALSGGMGMLGMSERLRVLGGSLHTRAAEGHYSLTMNLPLPGAA